MNLLNKLMETCATLTQKVANLEQDNIAQALEITKLKQRVKRRMHPNRGEIAELDANKDVTLVDVDAEVAMDANIQGRMAESQAKVYNWDLQHSKKVLSMQDIDEVEPAELEEVLEDTAKKQRIDEDAEELKRHLQIIANDDDDDDDDVYTEATPLASKVPVVDYQIHHENNKPYYKIIRADGTHQLFLSFITLLKNFDREDLETLWKLMILLVKKKYPLTHFTLQQMLDNVRLEVEEESEMSLELLRKRKPLEFEVGDKVMLKVSPWKGVIRFSKRGKLNSRYIGPFKILDKMGTIAYRLELPEQLSQVNSTFHVSNLKKCFFDEPLAIPLDEIQIGDKLNFIEEPVKIMDREVKKLKQSRIPIVKVRCNSRRGPKFT
nr:putative reverse transcriptase domain-containing protein [Tanacetum cinerariifolium]